MSQEVLYRMIELPSDKPVQYVGVYVLKWGKVTKPEVGFVPVEAEEVLAVQNIDTVESQAQVTGVSIGRLG